MRPRISVTSNQSRLRSDLEARFTPFDAASANDFDDVPTISTSLYVLSIPLSSRRNMRPGPAHAQHRLRMRRTVLLLLLIALPASADVFRILDDPRDAAQARVDVIEQARHEIDAAYFLARNDRITMSILRLLRDARRRGVERVRLIVDANFQHIPKSVLAHLSDEGVEIRVYHPLTLRHPTWLFHRMHEKFVVADGARYIAGGRNLAEPYFGLAKRNFVDRDVFIEGPSAADAQRHFDDLWSSADVADLDVHVRASEKERASSLLDDASLNGFVAFATGNDWTSGQTEVASVQFLHDDIATPLEELIARAKTSIVIESPYIVPTPPVMELFERKL